MKPDAEVRYADIEKLAKDFGTEKLDPYFKSWEERSVLPEVLITAGLHPIFRE